jgi:serine phosphatase RsbU (regulator of sigma subunit)
MDVTPRSRRLVVPLLVGIASGCWALAQEPAPARPTLAGLSGDGTIELTLAWRFHPGDDPGWADPRLDDRGWAPVDPRLPAGGLPRAGWTGTGWFRRHLLIDRGLWGKPLVLRVEAPGTTEVFLDGERLLVAGGVGEGRAGTATLQAARVLAFSPPEDHVLAVRRAWSGGDRPLHGTPGRGFHLLLEESNVLASQAARQRLNLMLQSVFTVLPVFLGVLHLALFSLYPKARENLFYGLWMLAFAWAILTDLSLAGRVSDTWRFVAERFNGVGVAGLILFLLCTYFAVRTRPFPRSAVAFAAGAGALAAAAAAWPARFWPWFWYLYLLAVTFEVLRIEIRGPKVRRDGVTVLLVAMGIQWVVIQIVTLENMRLLPQLLGVSAYFLALLPLALAMSFGLVRGVARTSTQLERKLVEVQTLSSQVLEQEREAHAHELRSRLLEADNERKTRELEGARMLQLSMLPASLPCVPGLDVAAAMTTATEVGGDYYDFRVEPDGTLLVALGDATGHGVSAGIVVTAVKAIFTSLEGTTDLPGFMARCSGVLQGMHTGPVRMCLAVARVHTDQVTLCAAATPPMLIHRAATATVEEVVTSGLPLGSPLAGRYQETTAPLHSGDTLLLTSDGVLELADPAGVPLGFEGAARALRSAVEGHAPAAVVVERLLAAATAWRGDREQADDLTLVVIRVTG